MVSLRYQHIFVDLSNLYARAFFAHQNEKTVTANMKEVHTGGITGGLEMLKVLRRDYLAPGGSVHILVDSHKNEPPVELFEYSNYRKSILPSYKANRESKGEEYNTGLPILKLLLLHLGEPYSVVEIPGLEADDLVQPLINFILPSAKEEILLVSNDEDWAVNITDHIIWKSEQNGLEGPEEFEARTGFPPAKVLMFKCFRGDGSDGIKPAVPGIRTDLLLHLIKKYDSLGEILANLSLDEEVSAKWKENIRAGYGALKTNEQVIKNIPIDDAILQDYYTPSVFNEKFLLATLLPLNIDPKKIDFRLKKPQSVEGKVVKRKPLGRRKLDRA